ncbi:BEN domain-containing protein 7 [Aplochiton taeniatus]
MEFGERKRRRKSQSFKLVKDEDFEPKDFENYFSEDVNEPIEAAMPVAWLGEEGMEIKKQITGMMRLMNDKAGRVYQRVRLEGDSLKMDPQHGHMSSQPPVTEDHQISMWSPITEAGPSPTAMTNGQGCSQYITRSKTNQILNHTKELIKTQDLSNPAEAPGPCCMCNCKSTLQDILEELRAMRRVMQRGPQEKQERSSPPCPPRPGPAPRRRPRKRRPIHKVAPLSAPNRGAAVPPLPLSAPAHPDSEVREESAVRLAEEFNVFIPKVQLDSILVNYTRSGSLLFRKLVCAFFDDATLANSLPNGKRKRGLNDNRKGLDQNIVGAIKVFTEKYCTAHRIEKLPGPRDWVQILQDQIKLARRRLKREAADAEEIVGGPPTGIKAHTDTYHLN